MVSPVMHGPKASKGCTAARDTQPAAAAAADNAFGNLKVYIQYFEALTSPGVAKPAQSGDLSSFSFTVTSCTTSDSDIAMSS